MRIDSHQHFWVYDRQRDGWITENMKVIQHNFLATHLEPILIEHNINGCVAVQAHQAELETQFLVTQANQSPFVKGVVGWVDLRAPQLEARLEYFKSVPIVKGFRHIVQAEPAGFMLQSDFINGIKLLNKHTFTYDILIREPQLEEALAFIKQVSDQKLVIDHIAKPIMGIDLAYWKKYIRLIARHEHVYCKISGLVTEAEWTTWKPADFIPYLDIVFETFGCNRVMYGSDWPVCLLAAQYSQQLQLVEQYIQSFTNTEKHTIMGENAIRFYNL